MKRRFLVLLAVLGLAGVTPLAVAAWLSSGIGLGAASAATVAKAAKPTAVAGVGRVDLSWSANAGPVDRYDVLRHDGTTVATVCSGVSATSCSDISPLGTTVSYGVVARVGSNWKGPESDLAAFTYDSTAPTTTITRDPVMPTSTWNNSNVAVTLSATDTGSGVKEIHYTLNSGTEQVVAGASTIFTVSREDANAVAFWAVDNAGNAENPHNTATVKIDKTAPVTSATPSGTSGSNGWYTSNVALALAAVDTSPSSGAASSGVTRTEYQLNSTSGSWTSGSSLTVSIEGTTTVYYRSTDLAGNVETVRSVVVKVDNSDPTAPTAVSPAPNAHGWNKADPTVTTSAADSISGVQKVEYSTGAAAGPWTAYPVGGVIVATEGTTTVWFRVTDNAGRTATTSQVVQLDKTNPTGTSSISPASPNGSNDWYRTKPTVTLTGADGLSGLLGISWLIDSAAASGSPSNTSPVSFLLNDGDHTGANAVKGTVSDQADNAVTLTDIAAKVDTVAPSVTGIKPASGTYNSANAWTNGTCNGAVCATVTDLTSRVASVTYRLTTNSGALCWNGTAFVTTTCTPNAMAVGASNLWTATSTIPASALQTGTTRTYALTVVATDNAGNVTTDTSVTFNAK